MKQEHLLIILLFAAVVVLVVVVINGNGSSNDEQLIEQYLDRINELEVKADSIQLLRFAAEDSAEVLRTRLMRANAQANYAQQQVAAARAQLQNLPRYETLTPDELARRADSLFVARSDR